MRAGSEYLGSMSIKRFWIVLCAAVCGTACTPPAFAHASENHAGNGLAWNGDPWIIDGMMLTGFLYALGMRRLWNKAE